MATLYRHQEDAFRAAQFRSLLLHHDCGTGKTATALHIIDWHRRNGFAPALVVCPLSIIESAWLEDAKKFTPHLSVVSLWQKPSAKKFDIQRKLLEQRHDVYVCNFETFKALFALLDAKQFNVLVVDESSKMKDYHTDITRALLAMAGVRYRAKSGKPFAARHIVPFRYCLSGTPAPNSELEYWPQVKFITGNNDNVFERNFYAFRNRYFYNVFANARNTMAQKWLIKPALKVEFNEKLKTIAHVVRKQDALDMPQQVHQVRYILLNDAERAAYDRMERDMIAQFGDQTVLAPTAMAQIMKLRQITSGFCYGEQNTHLIGKSKLNELADVLREIGHQPVIIWCNFKQEIQTLLNLLPNSVGLWSEQTDRQTAIEAFQTGKRQYLVANPQSAAHGLTFVNCCYAVYFSLNYSYELQKQSEDRIHRIGQTQKCTYLYLVAKGTIDEAIYAAVKRKANIQQAILAYLKGTGDDHAKKAV